MNGLEDAQRIVQDVLNSEHKYRQIIEAKGDDAQKCLDLLQVLAERLSITAELRPSILKMMLRLSNRSGLCPKCLVVRNVKKPRGHAVGGGGFGDVYKEMIGEQTVCLKVARTFQDSEDSNVKNLIKEYMKEAIVWKQLEHPNLLPFIGMYYLDEGHHQLCLISPWMDRGDLTRYLKRTPREQVNRLVLAYDVAAGLLYLHDKKIVHGDLKGLNVLINADERALIGDFGLSRVVEAHTSGLFTTVTTGAKGTLRWSSPELLDWESPCSTSVRSDIYAYACVCYEIFTGKQPFYKLQHDGAVINAVLNKKYPDRLEEAEDLNDQLWEIMVSCWQHDQYLRPSAADVLARIGEITNTKTGGAVRLQSSLNLRSSDRVQVRPDIDYPPIDTAVFYRLLGTSLPQRFDGLGSFPEHRDMRQSDSWTITASYPRRPLLAPSSSQNDEVSLRYPPLSHHHQYNEQPYEGTFGGGTGSESWEHNTNAHSIGMSGQSSGLVPPVRDPYEVVMNGMHRSPPPSNHHERNGTYYVPPNMEMPQYYPQRNHIHSSLAPLQIYAPSPYAPRHPTTSHPSPLVSQARHHTPPGQHHVSTEIPVQTPLMARARQHPWSGPLTPLANIPIVLDEVRYWLLGQLEYYLSEKNMAKDMWLRRKMSSDGWIPLSFIAGFKRIKRLTDNLGLVREVVGYSEHIEVSDAYDLEGVRVRMRDERWKKFLLPPSVVISLELLQDETPPVVLPL